MQYFIKSKSLVTKRDLIILHMLMSPTGQVLCVCIDEKDKTLTVEHHHNLEEVEIVGIPNEGGGEVNGQESDKPLSS